MEDQEYVWIHPHPTKVWYPGKIISKEKDIVKSEDSKKRIFDLPKDGCLYVKKKNLEIVEDLLKLPDFHEGLLLHVIRERYKQDLVYTSIGLPILIAVNPYKKLDQYSEEIKSLYRNQTMEVLKDSPPHLYKTGEVAYYNMKTEEKPQSIIITGESGAGKTESTKIILNYISAMKKTKNTLEDRIVYINPVLEAFGNAKTVKNDNSSRFGKFIELEFEDHLKSAKITNYLLEKTRIISQSKNERNYHIFYHLYFCEDPSINSLTMIDQNFKYKYLNLDYENFEKFIENDKSEFKDVLEKMKGLNFKTETTNSIFKIISGILHLGEVEIKGDEDKSEIETNDGHLLKASQLLGVEFESLKNLCINQIFVDPLTKQNLVKNLSLVLALQNRDTIAKLIYKELFDWIVKSINKAIQGEKLNSNVDLKVEDDMNQKITKESFFKSLFIQKKSTFEDIESCQTKGKIGILDIFGFEIFENNSFEQFCINYTNEKLQEHFNQHMFSLEQDLYQKENLPWEKIKFPDNKEIISLIEGVPISIYSLLDQLCNYQNSTDMNFLEKIRINFQKNPNFFERNLGYKFEVFGIKHFAGNVFYNVSDFIKKNKNSINSQFYKDFSKSENSVLREIFTEKLHCQILSNKKIETVSQQFRKQLGTLITELNKSLSLYVRCIKPNNFKSANKLQSDLVSLQLKAAGMLEAIKIRKAGYPIRRSYEEFYSLYKHLFLEFKIPDQNCRAFFEHCFQNNLLMKVHDQNLDTVLFGKNLIFMKNTIRSHLDILLENCYHKFAGKIQKMIRRFLWKKRIKNFKVFMKVAQLKIKVFNGIHKICKEVAQKKEFYQKSLSIIMKIKNKFKMNQVFHYLRENNNRIKKKLQLQAINEKLSRNNSNEVSQDLKESVEIDKNSVNQKILTIFDIEPTDKNIQNFKNKNYRQNNLSNNSIDSEIQVNQFLKYKNSLKVLTNETPLQNSIQMLDEIIDGEDKGDESILQMDSSKKDVSSVNFMNMMHKLKSENLAMKKKLNEVENQLFEKEKKISQISSQNGQELLKKDKLIKSLQENLQLYQFECANYKEKYVESRKELDQLRFQIKEGYFNNDLFEEKIKKINEIIEKKNMDIKKYRMIIKELKEKNENITDLSRNNLEVLKERELMLDNVLDELKNFRESQQISVSQFNMQNSLLLKQNNLCKDIINNLLTLLKWKTVENKLCNDIKNNLIHNRDSRILEENLESLMHEERILKNEVQIKMKKLENIEKNNQIKEINQSEMLPSLEGFKKTKGNFKSEIFYDI